MSNKLTLNTFSRGRNSDVDQALIQPDQYLSAKNVELTADGSFFSLKNIKGTTQTSSLLSDDNDILAVKESNYIIDGVSYPCITVFAASLADGFRIIVYNTANTNTYVLFTEPVGSDYFTDDRNVDVVNYPENGLDVLYFTDNYHEPRFLRCEINSYTPNFLNAFQISLGRKGSTGRVVFNSISATGGSLLTGTYQFAYRMVNPTSKKFTKWSSLTNPVHVYDKSNGNEVVNAGIGLLSTRKINLTVDPSELELANFEYYQLAVVENIGPGLPTTADLLDVKPVSGGLTYEYKSNASTGTIDLQDITVDLAQIRTINTLNVKQNRLFGGNIRYEMMPFDGVGTPRINSAIYNILDLGSPDAYSADATSSQYVGYFRDEVYRFGVVYTDENGNKSNVYPLSIGSLLSGNPISAGVPDVKFPARSASINYTLQTGSGNIRALGLTLQGLQGHPTWAASVEVVRLPRKKRILFQTPVIPMSQIFGTGSLQQYPSKYGSWSGSSTFPQVDDPNAQPMTAGSTFVPKNMFWPDFRTTEKVTTPTGSGISGVIKGEVRMIRGGGNGGTPYAMIFPQANMYGAIEPFVYTGNEKIDGVDYALLKCDFRQYSTAPNVPSVGAAPVGDYLDQSAIGVFHAIGDAQYFYNSTQGGKSIHSSHRNIEITDYEYFDNGDAAKSVGGNFVYDYEALQTKNTSWGYEPTSQRSAVIKVQANTFRDPTAVGGLTFKEGNLNNANGGAYVFGSAGMQYPANVRNDWFPSYAGFSNSNSNVGAVLIANMVNNMGDDRYGDLFSQGEYISTGSKYTFSDSERATLKAGGNIMINLNVWGGDCYINYHTFKVEDSAYLIVNQNKYSGQNLNRGQNTIKYNRAYTWGSTGTGEDHTLSMPVAYKNAAQFVQVLMESEFNGGVRDIQSFPYTTAFPVPRVWGNSVDEPSLRTPLSYQFNNNLTQQNSQKIYFPKLQYSFEQDVFKARVVYTDQKIYNSDQAGFDVFRALSFYDLQESLGGITKLALSQDELYAIQESGVCYLPIDANQLEQTTGEMLQVRSGDVIGRPIIIDTKRGGQHLRGILETGALVFIPDNNSRSIYALNGRELLIITQDNESIFRSLFEDKIAGKDIVSIYDPIRRQIWLTIERENPQIYNVATGGWIGFHEFEGLQAGVFTNSNLFLFNNSVHTMYTNPLTSLFGIEREPEVTFVINPDEPMSKTFDNFALSASQRVDEINVVVEREDVLGNQTIPPIPMDNLSIEGTWRVATPRDGVGARLRGLRAITSIKWFSNIQSTVRALYTKYRLSPRRPF